LAAAVLFCYFLFVGGWVWSVTLDYPTSTVLDSQRARDSTNPTVISGYRQEILESQDVAAAVWLRAVRSMNDPLCADSVTINGVLTSYGGNLRTGSEAVDDFAWCPWWVPQSYVFLSQYNTVGMTVYFPLPYGQYGQYSTSSLQPNIENKNRIFSDGAAVYS
jgi:hypothetical protein